MAGSFVKGFYCQNKVLIMDDLVNNFYALINARLTLMVEGFLNCVRKGIEFLSIKYIVIIKWRS